MAGQPAELLERDEALRTVGESLTRAARGEPTVLFIVGEPGIGKTTLLDRCCTRAGEAGFSVRRAGCSELEQVVPFGLLDRLFEFTAGPFSGDVQGTDGLRAAGAATASTVGTASGEARLVRYTRLLDWLRRSAPRPLLVAVDDLHWADVDSVELLGLLCRRLEALQVAVVVTARPWPSVAFDQARSLAHDRFANISPLLPLSEKATVALLERIVGGQLAQSVAEEVYAACAGNPLLLTEAAEGLARGGALATPAGKLGERIFLPRFAGVGGPGMRWARAASVLGTRFRPDLASRLSDLPSHDATRAVEALSATGLLRELPDGGAEFVHPLLRQAIYEDLSGPARRQLHARALAALLEERAPPAEAAPHAVGAQLRGDPKAVSVLVGAGHQALAAGAVETASEHFHAAARLAGTLAYPKLAIELAEACLLTGKLELAEETLRQFRAQEGLEAPDLVLGTRLQARILMAAARYPEAKRRFREASELAARSDPALAAETLLDGAFRGFLFEGQREALAAVDDALAILETAGQPPRAKTRGQGQGSRSGWGEVQRGALNAKAYLEGIGGGPPALDQLREAAMANLEASAGGPFRRSAWSWDITFGYANLAKAYELFDDCGAVFEQLLEEAERQGTALTFQSIAISHADVLWRLGRLPEAKKLLARAAELTDLAPSLAPFAWVGLAHICHEEGNPVQSGEWSRRVEAVLARIGGSPYLQMWLSTIGCRNLLSAGEVALAVQAGQLAKTTAERSGILEPCIVPWHGAAIEAEVAAGHLDQAEAIVGRLDEICRPLPCHAPKAVAAWGAALVAWRRGRLEDAQAHFDQALSHNAAVPMPLPHAETLIHYGRFLRLTGRVSEGRKALRLALSVLEGTEAGRLESAAQRELAGAGGRRRRSRPAEELTPREQMVAELAARGLTNAQIARALFLSAKTVDHHLSRTYAKLGVSSRRQLMLAWRASPETAPQPEEEGRPGAPAAVETT